MGPYKPSRQATDPTHPHLDRRRHWPRDLSKRELRQQLQRRRHLRHLHHLGCLPRLHSLQRLRRSHQMRKCRPSLPRRPRCGCRPRQACRPGRPRCCPCTRWRLLSPLPRQSYRPSTPCRKGAGRDGVQAPGGKMVGHEASERGIRFTACTSNDTCGQCPFIPMVCWKPPTICPNPAPHQCTVCPAASEAAATARTPALQLSRLGALGHRWRPGAATNLPWRRGGERGRMGAVAATPFCAAWLERRHRDKTNLICNLRARRVTKCHPARRCNIALALGTRIVAAVLHTLQGSTETRQT